MIFGRVFVIIAQKVGCRTKEGIKVLKAAELYTHTHTHTQLKRCRDFLCKLCLGAVLIFAPIFSFSATLPSGYTELEYIESTGEQMLNTGVTPGNALIQIDFDIQQQNVTTVSSFFIRIGNNLGSPGNGVGIGTHNDRWAMILPGTDWGEFTPVSYDRIQAIWTIDGNNGTSTLSGDLSHASTSFDHFGNNLTWRNQPVYFGRYTSPSGAINLAYAKFYGVKIRLDNTLVFDGIPAKRKSDGAMGMYDTVTNTFFENAGTGSFTAGPEIVEETYTFLEYIDIDSDYIDTGLYLYTDAATNHYPNIHYTFMPLRYRTDSTMTNYVGARSPGLGGGLGLLLGSTDNFSYIDYFDGTRYSGSSGTGVQLNTKYEYDIVNRSATLKDVTNGTTLLSHTFGNSTERSDNSLTINALPGCGTGICTSNNKLRIYDFEVEGEAHMIPAKRNSDGVIGMYDTVRNQFYTNTGVGTITAGPAVAQPTTVEIIWGGLAEPDVSGTCTYGETFTAPSTAPTAPSGLKFLGWRPI